LSTVRGISDFHRFRRTTSTITARRFSADTEYALDSRTSVSLCSTPLHRYHLPSGQLHQRRFPTTLPSSRFQHLLSRGRDQQRHIRQVLALCRSRQSRIRLAQAGCPLFGEPRRNVTRQLCYIQHLIDTGWAARVIRIPFGSNPPLRNPNPLKPLTSNSYLFFKIFTFIPFIAVHSLSLTSFRFPPAISLGSMKPRKHAQKGASRSA
jgi:hypothetical protein